MLFCPPSGQRTPWDGSEKATEKTDRGEPDRARRGWEERTEPGPASVGINCDECCLDYAMNNCHIKVPARINRCGEVDLTGRVRRGSAAPGTHLEVGMRLGVLEEIKKNRGLRTEAPGPVPSCSRGGASAATGFGVRHRRLQIARALDNIPKGPGVLARRRRRIRGVAQFGA